MNKNLHNLQALFNKEAAIKLYRGFFYCTVLIFAVLLTAPRQAAAQAPALSYSTPQTYTAGVAISPLAPTSSGAINLSYGGGNVFSNQATFFPYNSPEAIAADAAGNIYAAMGNVILEFNAAGNVIKTVLGPGTMTQAHQMVLDAAGNIYLTDLNRTSVLEVRASDGAVLNRGTGLNNPISVAVDRAGNIYVSDYNPGSGQVTSSIKKILAGTDSTVTVMNQDFTPYISLDASGDLFYTSYNSSGVNTLVELAAGSATPTTLQQLSPTITAMIVDPAGNAFVANEGVNNSNILMYPVSGAGPIGVGSVTMSNAINLGLDYKGNIYVADILNNQLFKIDPNGGFFPSDLPPGLSFDGNTGTFSGTPIAGSQAKNYTITAYNHSGNASANVNIKVLASDAGLSNLIIGSGTLSPAFATGTTAYTSTTLANSVTSLDITAVADDPSSAITMNGTAVTSAVPATLPLAQGLNVFSIVVTSTDHSTKTYTLTTARTAAQATVSYVSPQKYTIGTAITPLSPTCTNAGSFGSYLTKQAGIGSGYNTPSGVALDNAGNLYEADYGSGQVLKVPVAGGTPVAIGSGFIHPEGLAADSAGNIYVVDSGNNLVRKILAGTNTTVSIGTDFAFGAPKALAVDVNGNVFVADFQNKNIVEIHADASATSVYASTSNGTNPFVALSGIAVDAAGNVYVSDSSAAQLTKIPAGGTPTLLTPSFNGVNGLSVDEAGDLFVSDAGNSQVKMIPAGTSTAIVAANNHTYGLAVDAAGDLFIATRTPDNIAELNPIGGYFINKPLPAGLNFDYSTGAISGTPTVKSLAANYTVTINNYSSSGTGNVNIRVGSGNTALTSLAISNGTLSPVFNKDSLSYAATVPYAVSSVNVTPTTSDNTETVSVNGTTVASGSAVNVPLVEGSNTITTLVMAEDGVSTRTYTIALTRTITVATLSGITPDAGTLSPVFAANTTTYTLPEANTVKSVGLTIIPVDPGATIAVTTAVNGAAVTGSGNVYAIGLNAATSTQSGSNATTPVKILVTAINGTTQKEYDVNITRVLNSDVTLSNLTLTNVNLQPSFSAGERFYSAFVPYSVTSTNVTQTANDSLATVTVNGAATASGTAANVALAEGSNTISIVVTAQDGTTQTYSATITRVAAEAKLVRLLAGAPLSPAFDQAVNTYTVAAYNYMNSVDLTVDPSDTSATVAVVTDLDGATILRSGTFKDTYTVSLTGSAASRTGNTISAPVTITITAADGNSQVVYHVTINKVLSSDATLFTLEFSKSGSSFVPINPSFDPAVTSYTASVPYTASTVTVAPIANDQTATVVVNGTPVARFATTDVTLAEGDNTINTVVNAQDGTASQTYATIITRQAPPVTLSAINVSGSLAPAFDPNTTSYNVTIDHTLTSYDLNITATDPGATIVLTSVKDNTVITGSGSSYTVALNSTTSDRAGGNLVTPVKVVVTALDGAQKEYDININQAIGTDASLSGLGVSYGFVSPSFSAATHHYTSTRAPSTLTSIQINTFTTDPTATVTINGVSLVAGVSGAQFTVPLISGNNTVNAVVTAQDGTTTQTYTIVVPVGPADATLSTLASSSGGVSPALDPGTTDYTNMAAAGVSSVDITAIPTNSAASVSVYTGYDSVTIPGNNNVYTVNFNSTNSFNFPTYSGTLVVISVLATDNTRKTYNLNITRPISTNDTLSNISLSAGTLSPSFNPATTFYQTTVPYATSSFTINSTAADANATITLNGSPVVSGMAASANVGSFNFIKVTAQNGTSLQYFVFVNRGPADATLSGLAVSAGTLNPSFDPAITTYVAPVSSTTSSINITPTTTDTAATVTVNGTPVTSGTAFNVVLTTGDNHINTVVTGADHIATRTYLTIVNRPPADASLSNLTIRPGALSPSFDINNTWYQETVPYSVSSVFITPTATDPNAIITVNGTTVASGRETRIFLVQQNNYINIEVTGQDSINHQYYTAYVIRARPAQLTNLIVSAGALSPDFTPATAAYAVSVPDSVAFIAITPSADPAATITVNGTPIASGAAATINLSTGANVITIVVTGKDLSTYTYTVTVTRLLAQPAITYASATKTFFRYVAITPLSPSIAGVLEPGYGNIFSKIDSTSFSNPAAIAADAAGNIYVANNNPTIIYKIASGGTQHVGIRYLQKSTSALTSDASGNLYVGYYGGIKLLPADGSAAQDIYTGSYLVTGIAVDASGNIFFTTTTTHGVYKVAAGSTSTTAPVLISNNFGYPNGIAIDATGNLYVMDAYNTLMKIPAGSNTPGVANINVNNATGVSIDNNGNIFVAEYSGILQEIPANGGSVITLFSYPSSGGPGGTSIQGMAPDGKGNIYVAEFTSGVGIIDKVALGTFGITPQLPNGLTFDSQTGIISGTPKALSPSTNYTITAGNDGGNTSATVNIRVIDNTPESITFAAISAKTYGAADFDPGATCTNTALPVTYASSNPLVATIVANQIHITGVGSTTITASQAGDSTHLAAVDRTRVLTVNPAPLLLTGQNQSRYYGEANPVLAITYTGFVNGENQTVLTNLPVAATTATATSAPGLYPITLSGAAATNYKISYIAGSLRINAGLFTFGPLPVKKYGDVDFAPAVATSGITYATSDPTVAQIVNGKLHITGAGTANITASVTGQAKTQLLTVAKANLYISPVSAQKYSGDPNPALSVSYSGFVNGDTPASLTSPATATTAADASSPVGNYTITASGAASPNYNMIYNTAVLSVKNAGFNFGPLQAQTYGDGDVVPPATGSGITFTSGNTAVATIVNGSLHIVGAGSSIIKATSGGASISQVLTVKKAPLTVTADNQERQYGQVDPSFTFTYAGFVNGDGPASLSSPVTATANDNATSPAGGNYNVVASGGFAANYAITYRPGKLTIYKAILTIAADNKQKVVGDANPPLTITYSGFANGENGSVLTTLPAISTTGDAASPVGVYPIVVSGAAASNYTLSYIPGKLSVRTSLPGGTVPSFIAYVSPGAMPVADQEIKVSQAVSPNGDGIDDILTINALTKYPDNKLSIMNRNGVVIFTASDYAKEGHQFDGHDLKGNLQKPGTYFYLLEYKDGAQNKRKTGFIVLKY